MVRSWTGAGDHARRVAAVIALTLATASVASAGNVTLAWDPSTNTSVTGYIVTYGRTSGNYPSQVDVGLKTTTTITLPDDGNIYYIAVRAYSATAISGPSNEVYAVTRLPTSSQGLVTNKWKTDFSGAGVSSFTGWDSVTGMWRILDRNPTTSAMSGRSIQWGLGSLGDVLVPGDFDGDGRSDIAVWRPSSGLWFTLWSSLNFVPGLTVQWGSGALGDVPVPGDYDGDRRTDIAIWRPGDGMWYIKTSSSNYTAVGALQWGAASQADRPVPGDYDGDGRTDIAVWRPASGMWFVRTSSSGYRSAVARQWGGAQYGDTPVVGDFDGDGRSDLAVWRSSTGTWFALMSSTGAALYLAVPWGGGQYGDIPLTNDYDGDGISDMTVYRPSARTWYVRTSKTNFASWFPVTADTAWDTPLR